jgi:outer membrane protein TolC
MKTAVIVLALAGTAYADEPAKQTLTFEGAVQLALGRNPDVQAAKQALDSSKEKAASARANRWIQLNANTAIDEYKIRTRSRSTSACPARSRRSSCTRGSRPRRSCR